VDLLEEMQLDHAIISVITVTKITTYTLYLYD